MICSVLYYVMNNNYVYKWLALRFFLKSVRQQFIRRQLDQLTTDITNIKINTFIQNNDFRHFECKMALL